jgi:hypothetical protein
MKSPARKSRLRCVVSAVRRTEVNVCLEGEDRHDSREERRDRKRFCWVALDDRAPKCSSHSLYYLFAR